MKQNMGTHSQIKGILRRGYHYPVKLTLEYRQDALELIRDIKGDDGGYHAVVTPNWRRSPVNKVTVWFRDPELATMAKLVAG